MDVNVINTLTDSQAEALLKLLRRGVLNEVGRFAQEHPVLASVLRRDPSHSQLREMGERVRELAAQAIGAIAPDADPDSKPARARKLLECFYLKRWPRWRVMSELDYSLSGEGAYMRLRQHAITLFAQSLESLCLSLLRTPSAPSEWTKPPNVMLGRFVPWRTFRALVGRSDEIRRLEEWILAPEAPRVIWVHGMGGVGKTALVTEIVHRLLQQSPANAFDDVLWVSAKRQIMLGSHTHEIQFKSFRPQSLEAIVEVLLNQVGMTYQLGATDAEKRAALVEEMIRHRYLIILDNTDELDDEVAVIAGIGGLLGSSKLLITSRNMLSDLSSGVEHLALTGLSYEDSNAYLKSEAEVKNIVRLESAGDDVFADAHAATRGLPLALKLLAGQWRHSVLPAAVRGICAASAAHKDFLRYLFEQSWRQLAEPERALWVWLGRTAALPVARDQLVCIPRISNGLDEALASLTSRGIIEVTTQNDGDNARFSLHPLARAFVEELPRIVYVSEPLRVFHHHECFALAAPGWLIYAEHGQVKQAIQSDYARANMIGVAKGCLATGLHNEVILLWDRLSETLFSHSYWREYVELDYCCLDAARALKRTDVEITVLCELGWVLCDTTDYSQAHDYLALALQLAWEKDDIVAVVRAERYLATLDLRQKNYAAARVGFERLLHKIPRLAASADEQTRTRLMKQKSTLHDSLAGALMELGDLNGAEEQLTIRRQMPYAINSTADARSLISLARLRIKQFRLDEAELHLIECMDVCRQIDARDAFADALMALARVAVCRDDMARAVGLAEEALQLFGVIGALKREQNAKRFLISVHDGEAMTELL